MNKKDLYAEIKHAVRSLMPGAQVIIYGSYARNEENEDSDIDIMIISNAKSLDYDERRQVRYAIFDLQLKHRAILSPKVLTREEWEQRKNSSPFYESVLSEGIEI